MSADSTVRGRTISVLVFALKSLLKVLSAGSPSAQPPAPGLAPQAM
jgi:hypothetical protein